MGKFTQFTEGEQNRIREAVANLESSTSGELRPVFVRKSDDYVESRWFGASIGAMVGIAAIVIFSYLWLLPANVDTSALLLSLLLMMVGGFVIPLIFPVVAVQLAGQRRVDERVMQRAAEVFLSEEVFRTRKRIGILLMVSELERKIVLLADTGINELVGQQEWDDIVQAVISKVKKRAYAEGIVEAIDRCRDLLTANGFTPDDDDRNELPDDIRTID